VWNKIAIAFFYSTIKGFVKQFLGGLGTIATIPDDVIMAIIGYLVMTKTKHRDEGEALLLASVASLGTTMGAQLLGAFGVTPAPTAPTRAPSPTPAPTTVVPQVVTRRRVIM
jgi:membrane protein DedA with SNARE-associated domain